jgi:ferrous iron transport protein A
MAQIAHSLAFINSSATMENKVSTSTLDLAEIGDAMNVEQVLDAPGAPEWARWLEEIGFIVGERVMLMARGLPGGDPLVVRVGQSTFALRRAEAACIRVSPAAASLAEGRA